MVLNILNMHVEIWITASGSDEKSVSLTDLTLHDKSGQVSNVLA